MAIKMRDRASIVATRMLVPVPMPVTVLALALLLVACGDGAPAPATGERRGSPAAVPQIAPNGTVHTIRMITRDADEPEHHQAFEPRVVKARVGDTVTFVPTDPSHLSASIEGMLPEGVTGWEGALNEEISYTVPKPGIYGYKCTPHYAAGMIGLVIVEGEGRDANLELARAVGHPGLAGEAFEAAFAEAGL